MFERLDVYNVINQKRAYGKKDLLLVVRKNDYTTLYARHGTYKINPEKDEIVLIYYYLFGRDTPTLFYYLRKNLVEHAYLLNATNQVGNFRRRMAFHLNEVPELVEKINNKELKMKDIDEVIDIYFNKTEDM